MSRYSLVESGEGRLVSFNQESYALVQQNNVLVLLKEVARMATSDVWYCEKLGKLKSDAIDQDRKTILGVLSPLVSKSSLTEEDYLRILALRDKGVDPWFWQRVTYYKICAPLRNLVSAAEIALSAARASLVPRLREDIVTLSSTISQLELKVDRLERSNAEILGAVAGLTSTMNEVLARLGNFFPPSKG